jgi:hypothetical protein
MQLIEQYELQIEKKIMSKFIRRGLTFEGLYSYIKAEGRNQSSIVMEWDKLWAFNKKVIESIAPRYSALELNSVSVNVNGATNEIKKVQLHPEDAEIGTKNVHYGPKVLLEQVDADLMNEGDIVTFVNWGNLKLTKVEKKDGHVVSISADLDLDNKNFEKTLKVNWIVEPGIEIQIVQYDAIDKKENWEHFVDKDFKHIVLKAEEAIKHVKKGEIIQIQRKSFYICEKTGKIGHPATFVQIPDADFGNLDPAVDNQNEITLIGPSPDNQTQNLHTPQELNNATADSNVSENDDALSLHGTTPDLSAWSLSPISKITTSTPRPFRNGNNHLEENSSEITLIANAPPPLPMIDSIINNNDEAEPQNAAPVQNELSQPNNFSTINNDIRRENQLAYSTITSAENEFRPGHSAREFSSIRPSVRDAFPSVNLANASQQFPMLNNTIGRNLVGVVTTAAMQQATQDIMAVIQQNRDQQSSSKFYSVTYGAERFRIDWTKLNQNKSMFERPLLPHITGIDSICFTLKIQKIENVTPNQATICCALNYEDTIVLTRFQFVVDSKRLKVETRSPNASKAQSLISQLQTELFAKMKEYLV